MGTKILLTDAARTAIYTKVNEIADEKQDVLTFDNVPTNNSDNPVKSGGVYTALSGKQDVLTFDNVPTNNSDNPVKSGGVYTALSGKQDTLTFDNVPTNNSANPVKSGGVYTALTSKADDNSVPHLTEDETIAGIKTFTSSPIVPTPSVSDNSQKPATTAYINLKFQVVNDLPANPDANTFYCILESNS